MGTITGLDANGTILWYNDAMRSIIPYADNVVGENIDELIGDEIKSNLFSSEPVRIGNGVYATEGFTVSENNGGLYIIMLTDVTALREVEKRYSEERVAVAYIAIDNVEDVLQYVHEEYRDAVAVVDGKIKNWANSVNAVLKSYDNDKYVMLFDSKYLESFSGFESYATKNLFFLVYSFISLNSFICKSPFPMVHALSKFILIIVLQILFSWQSLQTYAMTTVRLFFVV